MVLVVLVFYVGGFIRVASSFRERTFDVFEVYYVVFGEVNFYCKFLKLFGVFDYILFIVSCMFEFVYEFGKLFECIYDGIRVFVGVDGRGCFA